MKLTAIILAAGRGERMGAGMNKSLLQLHGKPVLAYSLAMWQPLAQQIIVAAQYADMPAIQPLLEDYGKSVILAPGGASRASSVARALTVLPPAKEEKNELIAVHDAARPLTAISDIWCVIDVAIQRGAAILAAPVTDTIRFRQEDDADNQKQNTGLCGNILPREQLLAAQTPQIFRRDWLCRAYEQASSQTLSTATDDAALVQACGYNCAYVLAKHVNIKLTNPQDMMLAEAVIKGNY